MPESVKSKISTSLKWGLVLLWFGLASSLVMAMNRFTLTDFDHDNRLAMQLMSLDFEQRLVERLAKAQTMRGKRIVHIRSSEPCFCESLVASHANKLDALVAKQNTQSNPAVNDASITNVYYIDLSQHPSLTALVPSTPAIAVINEQEQLVYYGPYAQGSGCFSSAGEVDAVIRKELMEQRTARSESIGKNSAVIRAEARGCYCNQGLTS
ncbi:DUF6436 domain-containing protein [Glaciecola siphonariae]|uniref:DUF6436 domain-containing protein n=1 Tax=Glaciecola siphonariae TaxID=521012 RepID=A0ABV9LZ74_9ALTE